MVGSRADGKFGPKTAEAFTNYQTRKGEERLQWVQKIQDAANSPTVKAAREEIARLRGQAEAQIAQSNELINRLRNQLGQDTGVDIDAVIEEQNAKIKSANEEIDTLTEETYALEAEYRQLEAEVGPVKYIAEMIYGEADRDLLEEAVRWVIIIIVVVFDPLAIMMLLAATESFGWAREQRNEQKIEKQTGPTTIFDNQPTHTDEPDPNGTAVTDVGEEPPPESTGDSIEATGGDSGETEAQSEEVETAESAEKIVFPEPEELDPEEFANEEEHENIEESQAETTTASQDQLAFEEEVKLANLEKIAKKVWKTQNPNDTLKHQEALLERGRIDALPWSELQAQLDDNATYGEVGFGIKFPTDPEKGDSFIRVDYLPTKVYKYNGTKWIEINKDTTDSFAHNDEYIEHLIEKIGKGEYDPDLLNDTERDQIEAKLKNDDL